jgi:hydroxymethylbilane synthase
MNLKIGTRGSQLALMQTQIVADALQRHTPALSVEIVTIKTEGDHNRRDSLTILGGRGVFVRDIEDRLLAGEIDCAMHSLKDLPTTQPDGLALAAMLEREDARDVLVSRNHIPLRQLPPHATVGSSSQRRAAQLLALRPDLNILDIRGNVDTRLRKLDEGQYDALALAAAGLIRLKLAGRITQYFALTELLPAVGQGVIVIECRADDRRMSALLAPLDHAPTRAAVTAERAFLRALGGGSPSLEGCQLPLGAFAEVQQNQLTVQGLIARPDGQQVVRDQITGSAAQAESLGAELAQHLMQHGGRALMEVLGVGAQSA